jgi:hypothetical protein
MIAQSYAFLKRMGVALSKKGLNEPSATPLQWVPPVGAKNLLLIWGVWQKCGGVLQVAQKIATWY